jgi:hypothetical protein
MEIDMRRAIRVLILSLGALPFANDSASATTIHTSNFISTPANFDGFESLGSSSSLPQNTTYSEGGIDVKYVGDGLGTWTTFPYEGTEGQYNWYQNGGGFGYTEIKLSSGADFHAIQFLATAGNGTTQQFQFQLLNDGSVVDEGSIDFYTGHDATGSRIFGTYGFSDSTFDEVRLQSLLGGGPFRLTSLFPLDGLALDSIAIGTASVATTPLPAALPLFASALGGLGFFGWKRRKRGVAVTG